MARVKRGVTAHAKHKKVIKAAKGYYGRRKNTIRVAKQAVEKAQQYAYRDRKRRKRNFRALWIQRINAAVREHGLTYGRFINGLTNLGIDKLAPADGAFYVYADVRHLTDDSMAFCRRFLDDTGVAIVPGIDFDPVDGHHFVRMSFAGATQDIEDALLRLKAWL